MKKLRSDNRVIIRKLLQNWFLYPIKLAKVRDHYSGAIVMAWLESLKLANEFICPADPNLVMKTVFMIFHMLLMLLFKFFKAELVSDWHYSYRGQDLYFPGFNCVNIFYLSLLFVYFMILCNFYKLSIIGKLVEV